MKVLEGKLVAKGMKSALSPPDSMSLSYPSCFQERWTACAAMT